MTPHEANCSKFINHGHAAMLVKVQLHELIFQQCTNMTEWCCTL